jgi:hypothetical protein
MVKTDVAFVRGFDGVTLAPREAKEAGLVHRFAIIQETYRPDCVDMFFDVPLYSALLHFAETFEDGVRVAIRLGAMPQEITLEEFRHSGAPKTREDEPALSALVRSGENLLMWIETERWASVGGPMPYHDSYTYSLYTRDDVSDRARSFLAARTDSDGWNLAPDMIIPPAPRTSLWRRLLGRGRNA